MLKKTVVRKTTKTEHGPYGPRTVEVKTTEEVPLVAPSEWAMYTKKGNRRVQKIAEKAIVEVEAALALTKSEARGSAVKKALIRFLTRWDLLGDREGSEEVSDTSVREFVGNFHDNLAVASGFYDRFDLDRLWERHRDAAYAKATEIRKKRADKKKAGPPPAVS